METLESNVDVDNIVDLDDDMSLDDGGGIEKEQISVEDGTENIGDNQEDPFVALSLQQWWKGWCVSKIGCVLQVVRSWGRSVFKKIDQGVVLQPSDGTRAGGRGLGF